jgi:hypothetical protein
MGSEIHHCKNGSRQPKIFYSDEIRLRTAGSDKLKSREVTLENKIAYV